MARDPKHTWERRGEVLSALHAELSRREGALSTWRGALFLATIGLFATGLAKDAPLFHALGGLALAVFAALVVVHARAIARAEDAAARLAFARARLEGLARADAKASASPSEPPAPDHPFALDLDVVGTRSLLSHLAAHASPYGRDALAAWLLATSAPPCEEIEARQAAVRALAEQPELLEDLGVLGRPLQRGAPALGPLRAWAAREGALSASPLLAAARFLSPLTVLLFVLSRFALVPEWAPLAPLAVTALASAALGGRVLELFEVASREGAGLTRLEPLLTRLERLETDEPRVLRSREVLLRRGSAAASIRSLGRILSFADLRRSPLVHVPINLALAWDLWVAASLERWRKEHGAELPERCEAAGDLEALACLALLSHDHPDYAFPAIDDGAARFVAEGLAHPLLPTAERVANDVSIRGGLLLVTGSNMSGKSTLLRAIGVNAILGLAGGPVAARRLELHRAAVWTSLRVRDSLSDGVSHFYAEILRLRAVVGAAEGGERVLFLLDEVLHGTNSRERVIGAKAVARRLLELGAVGALTSHDLGVTALADEAPGKVSLGHFREHVEDEEMRFDYRLREGVVETSNALRLMKNLGLPVG